MYVSEEERASRLKSFLKRLEQDWIRGFEDSFSSEISESGMGLLHVRCLHFNIFIFCTLSFSTFNSRSFRI